MSHERNAAWEFRAWALTSAFTLSIALSFPSVQQRPCKTLGYTKLKCCRKVTRLKESTESRSNPRKIVPVSFPTRWWGLVGYKVALSLSMKLLSLSIKLELWCFSCDTLIPRNVIPHHLLIPFFENSFP
jgi:hypothetical protein